MRRAIVYRRAGCNHARRFGGENYGAIRDIILYLSCALAGKKSRPRPRMIRGGAAGEESIPIQDILVREASLST
jgi:hypothetical protein